MKAAKSLMTRRKPKQDWQKPKPSRNTEKEEEDSTVPMPAPMARYSSMLANERNTHDEVQLNAFSRWWHSVLPPGTILKDLREDIRSSHLLIDLIEHLSGLKIPGVKRKKKRRDTMSETSVGKFEALDNFAQVLKFCTNNLGINLKDISVSPDGLAAGNTTMINALTWKLINKYELGARAGMSSAELLQWVRGVVKEYPGVEIAAVGQGESIWESAFNDGQVFACLLDSGERVKGNFYDRVAFKTRHDRLKAVFEKAAKRGASSILDPREVEDGDVDSLVMITYVAKLKVAVGKDGSATRIQAAARMHKCRKKFKGGNLRRPSNETTFDRPAATPPRSAGMDQAGQTPPDETPSAVKAARSWLSGIVDNTQILSPTDSTPGGTAPAPAASAPAAAPTAAGPGLIRRLTSGLTSRTLLGGGNTDEKDKDNADKENALAKDEEEHPTQEPKWLQRAYSSMVDGHHTGAVPEDEPEPYRPSGRRASGVAQQNAEEDVLDEPSWLGQADKAVHPVAPVAPAPTASSNYKTAHADRLHRARAGNRAHGRAKDRGSLIVFAQHIGIVAKTEEDDEAGDDDEPTWIQGLVSPFVTRDWHKDARKHWHAAEEAVTAFHAPQHGSATTGTTGDGAPKKSTAKNLLLLAAIVCFAVVAISNRADGGLSAAPVKPKISAGGPQWLESIKNEDGGIKPGVLVAGAAAALPILWPSLSGGIAAGSIAAGAARGVTKAAAAGGGGAAGGPIAAAIAAAAALLVQMAKSTPAGKAAAVAVKVPVIIVSWTTPAGAQAALRFMPARWVARLFFRV